MELSPAASVVAGVGDHVAADGGRAKAVWRRPIAAVCALWGLIAAGMAVIVSCEVLLRRAGRGDLGSLGVDELPWAVAAALSATTGGVLALRARHAVGWLMIGVALAVTGIGAAQGYAGYGAEVRPGALPAALWVAPFYNTLFPPILALVALITLLTPSGRLATEGSRAIAVAVVVGAAAWSANELLAEPVVEIDASPGVLVRLPNPWLIEAIDHPSTRVVAWIGIVVLHLGVVAAGWNFIRRFRRASGIECQQLRWVAYGAAFAAVALVAAFVAASTGQSALLPILGGFVVCVLPVTVTLAISRYRLYDLDRIISRSVLLLVLTVMVTAVYLAAVVVLSWLGGSVQVNATVAAVGAAVAVAPLRSAAQRWIDRSLFGRRAEPFTVVSGLNRRLQAATSPDAALQELTDVMASDLRLPFVGIESADGRLLAQHGEPTHEPPVRWPLNVRNRAVGVLLVGLRRGDDAFSAQETALLDDLAHHAAAAVEAAALVDDLRSSQRRLVTAREEERRRMRRDLHDGLGPQLTAVTLKIDAARNLLRDDPGRVDDVLAAVRGDVRAAIEDIRRVVYELRPPGLDDLGLVGALRHHAAATPRTVTPQIVVTGDEMSGLPASVEVAAYRIATEAITNTVRHANARQCLISVACDDDLTVEITDDGVGLPPAWTAGVGITSMRERAEQLGGRVDIESAPGGGTTIRALLPIGTTPT